MAVETKPPRPKNRISADILGPPAGKNDSRSLPATVEWLRREGLLLETDVEVDGDLELTGVQKHFDGSYPVLLTMSRDIRMRARSPTSSRTWTSSTATSGGRTAKSAP